MNPLPPPEIGLVTSAELPNLDPDCQPLLSALKALGVQASPVIWDDPACNWGRMKGAIIQSTWDYQTRRQAFLQWAETVSQQTRLWNPASIVRWNTDKTYLHTFAQRGVTTVETRWLTPEQPWDLASLLKESGWDSAILKPVISAGSANTYHIQPSNLAECQNALNLLLQQGRTMMLQPYLHAIETAGERSLVFIDGAFSHAVVKLPARGDFRIQKQFGGSTEAITPTEAEKRFAEGVLEQVEDPWLYARVDILSTTTPQTICLMELELVEPSLYLPYAPASAHRLASALVERLL
jgi:glutathione synthase/RimK-type ligase-like ATP-grasp enzyme